MALLLRASLVCVLSLVFVGCQKSNNGSSLASSGGTSAVAAATQKNQTLPHLDHAQPKLPTIKLWLGSAEVEAEQALSLEQIATGMMFRKEMGENEGMLFVFGRAHRTSFYMKNTSVPLSCAYIDPEGTILEIHDMKPLEETPIEAHHDNILYVLEMKQGWFQRHNIGEGTVLRTERGSLPQTYPRYSQ